MIWATGAAALCESVSRAVRARPHGLVCLASEGAAGLSGVVTAVPAHGLMCRVASQTGQHRLVAICRAAGWGGVTEGTRQLAPRRGCPGGCPLCWPSGSRGCVWTLGTCLVGFSDTVTGTPGDQQHPSRVASPDHHSPHMATWRPCLCPYPTFFTGPGQYGPVPPAPSWQA